MVRAGLIAFEVIVEPRAKRAARIRVAAISAMRRRTAACRRCTWCSTRLRIVVAAMIPDNTVVAAMVPGAVTVVAMVVMIVIVVAIMVVVVVMVVVEEAPPPSIKPDKSVIDIEIVVLRRSIAADAGIVGSVTRPLVEAPVAAYPVVVIALPVTIVERPAIPLTVEIDRTVSDRIIPKIFRTPRAVAIAARLVGKSDAAAWSVEAVGTRRHACK